MLFVLLSCSLPLLSRDLTSFQHSSCKNIADSRLLRIQRERYRHRITDKSKNYIEQEYTKLGLVPLRHSSFHPHTLYQSGWKQDSSSIVHNVTEAISGTMGTDWLPFFPFLTMGPSTRNWLAGYGITAPGTTTMTTLDWMSPTKSSSSWREPNADDPNSFDGKTNTVTLILRPKEQCPKAWWWYGAIFRCQSSAGG